MNGRFFSNFTKTSYEATFSKFWRTKNFSKDLVPVTLRIYGFKHYRKNYNGWYSSTCKNEQTASKGMKSKKADIL